MRHAGNKAAAESEGIVLRASTLAMYLRCPYQFFRTYINHSKEVEEKTKKSAAAALGTAVHKAMEVGLLYKRDVGNPSYELMAKAALEEWNQLNKEGELWFNSSKGENKEDMETQLYELVKRYHQIFIPLIEPVHLERVLIMPVDNPIITHIQGSIDVEEKNGVRDLKITGRKTTAKSHILQLSVYSLLRKYNGEENDYGIIDNIVKNKSVTTDVIDVELKEAYTKNVIDTILAKTKQWYETKDDSIWYGSDPINNFLCTDVWCAVWDSCPYVKGWDDKNSIEGVEI